jgi:golgi-specific brefeldin A-resistance guanine nucleotide exchange factor 1
MIATVSQNTASLKKEGSCSDDVLPKSPTSTEIVADKTTCCEDEHVVEQKEPARLDKTTTTTISTAHTSACIVMVTMEDESESSVSALTPEGALIRETSIRFTTEALLEPAAPMMTPPTTKDVVPLRKLSSPTTITTENHHGFDAPPCAGAVVVNESTATTLPLENKEQQCRVRQVVHAACQSVLAVLRADPRYVSNARFTEELSAHEIYGQHSLHLALQQVLQTLQTSKTVVGGRDDFYLDAFCEAVRRRDVSAAVTGAVLTALHKFVSFRLVDGSLDKIANGLIHCAFEETTVSLLSSATAAAETVPAAATAITSTQESGTMLGRRRASTITQQQPHLEESRSSNAEDEQVVLKLLQLCVLTVQTAVSTTVSTNEVRLSSGQITALLDTCWHVRHKAATASALLKSAAAFAAQQIISAVFSATAAANTRLTETRCEILHKLSNLLVVPLEIDAVAISKAASAAHEFAAVHSLTLLILVLETNDGSFGTPERDVLERAIFRDVTALAVQTADCTVLQHCFRVVHQLLSCLHLEHLKCELEVFVHAVHLRRLEKDSASTPEEKEVVLDGLLELCHAGGCSPMNLQDLYLNYDCDGVCTNLFEAVVAALVRTARPANWTTSTDTTVESRTKSAVTEMNIPLSAGSVHSTTPQTQMPLDMSKGKPTPNALSSTSTQTPAATTTAHHSKPVQTVTVASHAPLNHLNRLALEGILSVLELIAQGCEEGGSSNSGNTVTTVESSTELSLEGCLDGDDFRSACFGAEGLSEEVLQARKQTKNARARVVQVFNTSNPDKCEWLKVAVAEGLLESSTDSKAAAELLHKGPEDLDKRKLGIYLSRGPDKDFPFQASVRYNFAAIQDFSGLPFAAALRKFLSKFLLPGEAQCIDRLMEAFSKEFFLQQCGYSFFKNADAVYVLAFSTIMLNTDLHNPTIKAERRMTKEQFVKNNRGINGGEDLSEAFLSDLYDQIKGRELQVRPDLGVFLKKNKQDYKTAWEGVLEKKGDIASPVRILTGSRKRRSGSLNKDMFLILANSSVQAIIGIFTRSWDDALVVRTLRGLQQMVKLAAFFELDRVVNDVLQVLLPQGRDYILNCITLDQSAPTAMDGGASVETSTHVRNNSTTEDIFGDDETTVGAENDQLIPFGLLCSSDEHGQVDISGSASNRGLLALDSSFVLLRKNSTRVTDAWPAFIECLCALRDARALPSGLSDLDDFADSNGNVLPLSLFARASQKKLDEYHRSLADKYTTKNKGWFRSFFRKGKSEYQNESTDDVTTGAPKGELSVYGKTLLGVAEAADVENIVQMGSSQLPDATIRTLLDVLDSYPFENDPVGEQHAVFTLELAARALLSNRERAEDLFVLFLSKFENVLCKVTEIDNDVPAPFVIERIVVTILRSSIHLYEYPEVRQKRNGRVLLPCFNTCNSPSSSFAASSSSAGIASAVDNDTTEELHPGYFGSDGLRPRDYSPCQFSLL